MVYCYGATEILTLNAAGIKNKDFFALTGEFVSDLAKVLNFEKNNDYYLGFDKLGKKLILTIDGKYVELFGTNGLGKAIEKLFSEKKYLNKLDAFSRLENKLAVSVGTQLHKNWRTARKIENEEKYEPRWKKIKDAKFISNLDVKNLPTNIRITTDGFEIDIANSTFEQLSPDWKKENLEAGKIAAGLVIRFLKKADFTEKEIGDEIHNEWLKRNTWAKEDPVLSKPFSDLPKIEQIKDLNQYNIALKFVSELITQVEDEKTDVKTKNEE